MTITKLTISHLIESNNIFICDFNDSFTFNIFSDLLTLDQRVVVRSFKDIHFWKRLEIKKEKFILILGPGPGHPKEYNFSVFKTLMNSKRCFTLGICLGHQIILQSLGAKTVFSHNKIHGQQVDIIDERGLIFNKGFNSKFQRYNSLTSDVSNLTKTSYKFLFDKNGELMVFSANLILSCQFHPESVGTNCPNSIYNIALKFLL
jgi:anthranilate/para-aminobenzoate synthase component II